MQLARARQHGSLAMGQSATLTGWALSPSNHRSVCAQIQLSIGEEIMVAMATATAAYLTALPPPVVPRVTSGEIS